MEFFLVPFCAVEPLQAHVMVWQWCEPQCDCFALGFQVVGQFLHVPPCTTANVMHDHQNARLGSQANASFVNGIARALSWVIP